MREEIKHINKQQHEGHHIRPCRFIRTHVA
jgi:hypothetical protein